MIPEDLPRTMQFIVESQARLAAAQEQDRHDRVKFEEWSKALHDRLARVAEHQAQLLDGQTGLVDHQSQRMDRLDKLYEDWLRQNADFHKQVLHLLNMILDRLPHPRAQG